VRGECGYDFTKGSDISLQILSPPDRIEENVKAVPVPIEAVAQY